MSVPHGAGPQDPGAVRATLRRITAPAHARLHAHPAFAALGRGTLPRAGYVALLLRLHGLHAALEQALDRFAAAPLLAWRQHGALPARSARLRQDLVALGIPEAGIAASPRATTLLPPLCGPVAALGCAWVVEGSSRGGQILCRQAAAILTGAGLPGESAFFTTSPQDEGRWQGCCRAAESLAGDGPAVAAMAAAASLSFGAFEAWLDPAQELGAPWWIRTTDP